VSSRKMKYFFFEGEKGGKSPCTIASRGQEEKERKKQRHAWPETNKFGGTNFRLQSNQRAAYNSHREAVLLRNYWLLSET